MGHVTEHSWKELGKPAPAPPRKMNGDTKALYFKQNRHDTLTSSLPWDVVALPPKQPWSRTEGNRLMDETGSHVQARMCTDLASAEVKLQ